MTLVLLYLVVLILIAIVLFALGSVLFGRGESLPPLPRDTTATVLPASGVTGADVDAVKFSQTLRGYKTSEVDWVLDRLGQELDLVRGQLAAVRAAHGLDDDDEDEHRIEGGAHALPSSEDRGRSVTAASDGRVRCAWIDESRLSPDDFVIYRDYHDTEWGQPLRDSKALFERVTLEAFQSGLSWLIILRKRENFRRAFHRFDVERIARYGERDITRLMADAGIVRNRAKIEATIANARAVARSGCGPRRVAVVVRAAAAAAAGRHGRRPGGHPGVDRDGQGTEAARLPVRRADDRLRLDAGDRNGRRPHRRLLGASDIQ